MKRTAVLNVVGLTQRHIGPDTPAISQFLSLGQAAFIDPAFPAVTCTAQSNYLTGQRPRDHGIVGNGWYNDELAEVTFWKQPNQTVQSPKLWHDLRLANSGFTCATMFWWFNMYADVEWSATPRPMYPADGSKHFDIYTWPHELRPALKEELGEFPFPAFWGPMAGQQSPVGKPEAVSEWIANAAKWIEQQQQPTLNLVYLPHLDYNLQRLGPGHPEIANDLQRIDRIVGELIDFFEARGVQVVLLSEYGITPVERPVHLNRIFRERPRHQLAFICINLMALRLTFGQCAITRHIQWRQISLLQDCHGFTHRLGLVHPRRKRHKGPAGGRFGQAVTIFATHLHQQGIDLLTRYFLAVLHLINLWSDAAVQRKYNR